MKAGMTYEILRTLGTWALMIGTSIVAGLPWWFR